MGLIHYNLELAIYSFFVAIFFCYLSALLAEQFLSSHSKYRKDKVFILLSGFFLGLAVWITFFFAILQKNITNDYQFDYALIIVAFLITFISSTFAVWAVIQPTLTILRLIFGSILMGLGISGMHYIGTMGLLVDNHSIIYEPKLIVFSTIMAILGAGCAFALTGKYKKKDKSKKKYQLLFAIIMALSIVATHYVGILSISFYENLAHKYKFVLSTNHTFILFTVILISIAIFFVSGIIAFLEHRLDERNRQLIQVNHDLANQELQDSLTKLPNRFSLIKYDQHVFSLSSTSPENGAVLYIDLDQFKAVNEVFGHRIGDRLLIQLVNRLNQHLGENERLFRVGGDEFVLILENATKDAAVKKAKSLHELIHTSFVIDDKDINISASIGISLYHKHGKDLQELIMNADLAMLNAKEQGRNTYTIFNYSDDLLQIQHQKKLLNDLYKAVEENQFILFYQPKFTAKDNQICGVEALIRWKHASHGLLTPSMFIKGAETTGVIIQMGYWVLEEAIKQIQLWEKNNINLFPVAVNLSVVQFEHKELFSVMEQLFVQYKIDPSHLMIEITESIAMHNIDLNIYRFDKLHQMGVKLAIDDFGTGYSSLLYLKNLSIDELKIDRAFIQDIDNDDKGKIILESIINLAIQLNLTVTAEGVETPVQLELLREFGCQQLQGFLLGMPMSVQDIEHCLK